MKASEIATELIRFSEEKSRICYMNGQKKSSYDHMTERLKELRKICREQETAISWTSKELDKLL